MEYINLLNRLSLDIYKSQKLSKEDICLEQISDFEKLFLFGFYEYYDELDKFDINSLNFYGLYKFDKNLLMIAAYYNKIRLIKNLVTKQSKYENINQIFSRTSGAFCISLIPNSALNCFNFLIDLIKCNIAA